MAIKNSIRQKNYRDRLKLAAAMYLDLMDLYYNDNYVDFSTAPAYTVELFRQENKNVRNKKRKSR